MESLDNIANTTSYNGQSLLSGSFTNKEFQVGAYSNQTVTASIGATSSQTIGSTRFETGANVTAAGTVTLTFSGAGAGGNDVTLASVVVDRSANSGLGLLADTINKNSDLTGITATATVISTSTAAVAAADITGLTINGIVIGTISGAANDSNGNITNAINSRSAETGVVASITSQGQLELTSTDGRGMEVSGAPAGIEEFNFGRLTLVNQGGADIVASASTGAGISNNVGEATVNLADVRGNILSADAIAMGAAANATQDLSLSNGIGAGVTTLTGAMATMDVAQSAQKLLDSVRADLGSVQNQLVSTVNNISVTQVNVAAAESQIRDVDFAAESANFSRLNILAQSGSYAMSQANAVQQNVLRLLQ